MRKSKLNGLKSLWLEFKKSIDIYQRKKLLCSKNFHPVLGHHRFFSKERVVKRIIVFFLSAMFIVAAAFAQAPYPYRALDPRQFDPKVDPDIDMFVNHWNNSTPRVMFGFKLQLSSQSVLWIHKSHK
jgi:hypothetical protein